MPQWEGQERELTCGCISRTIIVIDIQTAQFSFQSCRNVLVISGDENIPHCGLLLVCIISLLDCVLVIRPNSCKFLFLTIFNENVTIVSFIVSYLASAYVSKWAQLLCVFQFVAQVCWRFSELLSMHKESFFFSLHFFFLCTKVNIGKFVG